MGSSAKNVNVLGNSVIVFFRLWRKQRTKIIRRRVENERF